MPDSSSPFWSSPSDAWRYLVSFALNALQPPGRGDRVGCGRWIDRVVLQYHTSQAFDSPCSALVVSLISLQ
jgi:hypothetical protein